VKTIGDVRNLLRERGGVWAEALAEGRALRMAYNQEMAEAETTIAEGGEIAFFPPVTGG
jgi:molybdopterin synthase sulfur carrier subunit